ncbi:phage tail tape measure protein, TP901 family, core region [Anaerovirgula multivorans]|uniref:Phage tail tape measure protein, TP901 family, core region n=1 Tax=Anaerovirgula multivorans TaxID=312168 RepID=A0A239HXV5_9FIRM|nr:phage tail tape measure protein [Anaerovirgula multivorans]SNS85064.1 phage tail tape measure protein, TP901 family, core region [Anaerovirgula multivorans]
MDETIRGSGKGAEAFAKLGLSATDSTGALKSQEQMFEETVIALQNMEDGTEKARLATELFGKQGSELMPLLNGAAGSVEEMKKQAHELGLVLSDEAIDAGVVFTGQTDQVKRMLGSVATQVGVGLMPIISKFLDWVMQYMPEILITRCVL